MLELPHTSLVKIKGKWYVNCTIPEDLRPLFKDRKQIRRSTGTADKSLAERRKHSISSEIYEEFARAKPDRTNEIFDSLCKLGVVPEDIEGFTRPDELTEDDLKVMEVLAEAPKYPEPALPEEMSMEAGGIERERVEALEAIRELRKLITPKPSSSGAPLLSTALKDYLDAVSFGRDKTKRDVELSVERVIEFVGDIPLDKMSPVGLEKFAQHLHDGGSAHQTISKRVTYLKGMFKYAVNKGWIDRNPIADYTLSPKLGKKTQTWIKLEKDELSELFGLEMPDHVRLLFSILIATGMRLDEAALLKWEDVKSDGSGQKYFDLTGVDAILKNTGSMRMVPVPVVIDGLLPEGRAGQIFPQFKRDTDGKASTAASKVLMRLVKKAVKGKKRKVVHSLRGSLKDMLRDAGVSKEVNDFITGHGSGDVAGSYGSGPSLETRREALDKVEHPWLSAS